jgi:hypothetical protein
LVNSDLSFVILGIKKIIELVRHLPKTSAGRYVSGQIQHSGTSPAPKYGEARGAECLRENPGYPLKTMGVLVFIAKPMPPDFSIGK